jgi:hypothetical protein
MGHRERRLRPTTDHYQRSQPRPTARVSPSDERRPFADRSAVAARWLALALAMRRETSVEAEVTLNMELRSLGTQVGVAVATTVTPIGVT